MNQSLTLHDRGICCVIGPADMEGGICKVNLSPEAKEIVCFKKNMKYNIKLFDAKGIFMMALKL